MKGVCKLVSRVLKTCFLLVELDTLMSHRSRVFYTRFQKTQKKEVQTQKKKKEPRRKYKPQKKKTQKKKKEPRIKKEERSTNPRKRKPIKRRKNPEEIRKPIRKKERRRRPTAHTNPVSIKHIPIVDLRYSSRSPSPSKQPEQITHNS